MADQQTFLFYINVQWYDKDRPNKGFRESGWFNCNRIVKIMTDAEAKKKADKMLREHRAMDRSLGGLVDPGADTTTRVHVRKVIQYEDMFIQ